MSKHKGFKMLHFKDRRAVMQALKGINLSVWLYHYWRTDEGNVEVVISLDELEAEVPYSKTQIKYMQALEKIEELTSQLASQGGPQLSQQASIETSELKSYYDELLRKKDAEHKKLLENVDNMMAE